MPTDPPDDDAIRRKLERWLAQDPDPAIPWRPSIWAQWLPIDDWLPTRLIAEATVRREDLRELGNRVALEDDPEVAAGFITATCAWGSGVGQRINGRMLGDPRGPWRAAHALGMVGDPGTARRQPTAEPLTDRVRRIRECVLTVRRDGPSAAYTAMLTRSGRLPGWAESYFTKLLYAGGYGHGSEPWPLVCDRRVRSAMASDDIQRPLGRHRRGYEQWIRQAHEWASKWSVSPEQVEFAVFRHG